MIKTLLIIHLLQGNKSKFNFLRSFVYQKVLPILIKKLKIRIINIKKNLISPKEKNTEIRIIKKTNKNKNVSF